MPRKHGGRVSFGLNDGAGRPDRAESRGNPSESRSGFGDSENMSASAIRLYADKRACGGVWSCGFDDVATNAGHQTMLANAGPGPARAGCLGSLWPAVTRLQFIII